MRRRRVLIVCTGNAARSQMAEAWLRRLGGRAFEAFSAGTHPRPRIHPLAIRAMDEAGVELRDQWPKDVDLYAGEHFDDVITVCDNANESCPTFPGDHRRLHWSLDDPARAEGSVDERLRVFERVRDEIERRIRQFISEHTAASG